MNAISTCQAVETIRPVDMERVIEILLVEDNQGDVRLCREALKRSEVPNNLSVARDGVEALKFLCREGEFHDAPRPDLILLDLNLPRKDGREILAEIKTSDNLKRIPVIILTTSRSEDDITGTYNLHANCYITKTINFKQFIKVVKSIEIFWLSTVTLPSK
jgi:chemotaxis family two-component system response regulator Rcp1